LNATIGVKYDLTQRISAFFEINSIMATTEELDGAAIEE
jgi:hypothetical protein